MHGEYASRVICWALRKEERKAASSVTPASKGKRQSAQRRSKNPGMRERETRGKRRLLLRPRPQVPKYATWVGACRTHPRAHCHSPRVPARPLQEPGLHGHVAATCCCSPSEGEASLKAHMKSNPLYTDMRLTELAEVKRGQPSWTIEEYARNSGDKGKLTALDLQVSLSAQGGVR